MDEFPADKKPMQSVSGSMALMTLPDVMQWAETNRKSGTLEIRQGGVSKTFYLQDGKIIFLSSQKDGERLGEFFCAKGHIDRESMSRALQNSRRFGVPFTGYLISEGIIGKKELENLIMLLAETAFTDALTWTEGFFEFTDALPPMVVNGPVQISTSYVVFQSAKQFDETPRQKNAETRPILAELARQITSGDIELPPAPIVMQKLNSMLQRDDTPVQDIVEVIKADQVLTAKILRVVNSAFYSPASRITSLHQAIIFMGLKSVLSIATIQAMSGFSARNSDQMKAILHHSLLCAIIAKRIASAEKLNAEEAFASGLLHDIGKTILLNLTQDMPVSREEQTRMIGEYHESAGYLVMGTWKFSEVLQVCAGFHHHPDQAPSHRKMAETVFLADLVANNRSLAGKPFPGFDRHISDVIASVRREMKQLTDAVNSLL